MQITLILDGYMAIATKEFDTLPEVGDEVEIFGARFRVASRPCQYAVEVYPWVGVERVSEPTVNDIRHAKGECERAIKEALYVFYVQTGVCAEVAETPKWGGSLPSNDPAVVRLSVRIG